MRPDRRAIRFTFSSLVLLTALLSSLEVMADTFAIIGTGNAADIDVPHFLNK